MVTMTLLILHILVNTAFGGTQNSCDIDQLNSCEGGKVCAKFDSGGEAKCRDQKPAYLRPLGFPFDNDHEVVCTQAPRHGMGTHGYENAIFAVDLATPYAKKPGTILAGVEGTAYVYNGCKTPKGTAQLAKADDCGWGFGNYVQIVTTDGYAVLYAHLSKVFVKDGSKVRRGQRLGIEGWTGQAGHRHLHWHVSYLGSNAAEEQKRRPGWDTQSVPFTFYARQGTAKRTLISVDELKCVWGDMSQSPFRK